MGSEIKLSKQRGLDSLSAMAWTIGDSYSDLFKLVCFKVAGFDVILLLYMERSLCSSSVGPTLAPYFHKKKEDSVLNH